MLKGKAGVNIPPAKPLFYTDKMTLDRADFIQAMKNENHSVIYGLVSNYMAKRYEETLISNIHKQALKMNDALSNCNGEIATLYFKAILNGLVDEEGKL